jgi:hypothetical protein
MADLPLVRHDPAAPFARRPEALVTAGAFLAQAARLAALLPERSHVINLCADRLLFTVAFAAALMRGQVSLMPPHQTPDAVSRLMRDYPDSYRLEESFAGRPGGHGTAPARMPAVPEERVAAIVFTSGSTGDPVPHPKTWGGLVDSATAEIDGLQMRSLAGITVLGTVPPQHMFGLESTVVLPMQAGFVMHAGRPFFPADVCAELEALPRPRGLVTTPVHLRALLEEAGALPQLDFMLSATAPARRARSAGGNALPRPVARDLRLHRGRPDRNAPSEPDGGVAPVPAVRPAAGRQGHLGQRRPCARRAPAGRRDRAARPRPLPAARKDRRPRQHRGQRTSLRAGHHLNSIGVRGWRFGAGEADGAVTAPPRGRARLAGSSCRRAAAHRPGISAAARFSWSPCAARWKTARERLETMVAKVS